MAAVNAGGDVGCDTARRAVKNDFRFRVRLVAMPFLDSVMDGTVAFVSGLIVTLIEFFVCLAIYGVFRHDDLPWRVRVVLYTVATVCMAGKMWLALVAIFPLKEEGNDPESVDDRGGVVTDASIAGPEVERGVAPLEGMRLQPATHTAPALATSSASSGDVKVEDSSEHV